MTGTYVFTHALRDFSRGRRLAVWFVIALVVWTIAASYGRLGGAGSATDKYVLLSATLSYRIVALAAAIFASAVVAQEVEGKTIVYLLTRPIPRQAILLGRVLAASLIVFGVTALCAVGISFATVGAKNPVLAGDLVSLAVGSLAYTSFFTLLSLILNKSMVASLLFAFGWETLAAGVPGDLRLLTLNSHLIAIAQRPTPEGGSNFIEAVGQMLATANVSSGAAWLVLLGVIGVSLVGSMAWFSHFEYTAREDAE